MGHVIEIRHNSKAANDWDVDVTLAAMDGSKRRRRHRSQGVRSALAQALRRSIDRRSALRQAAPRALRDRRLELPPGADRRGDPAHARRRRCDGRALPRIRRAYRARAAAAPAWPGKAATSPSDRFLEVHATASSAIDRGQQALARVEPGCVLDICARPPSSIDLTFGPDPATHDHNTLGGMLGNNSCGVHSVMAGRTVRQCRSRSTSSPTTACA